MLVLFQFSLIISATKCNSDKSVAIMNTNQTDKNPDQNNIAEAWNFFMTHVKKSGSQ